MQLLGKTAVITGSASGIGEACAHAFAEQGARVVVADVQDDAGHAVVEAIGASGAEAVFVHCDVRSRADVAGTVAAAVERWGRLDVIMNNAGIASDRDNLLDLDEALFDEITQVNLRGAFFGMQLAVPVMIEQGSGVILSTVSISGLPGMNRSIAYGAAKAGVMKMTVAVAALYAQHGIRANSICPGLIRTPLTARHGATEESFAARQPVPRSGRPEDIAHTATWLASDDASFITGQNIVVDGGAIMAGWGRDFAATP